MTKDRTSGTPVATFTDEHERDENGRLPARRTKLTPQRMETICEARKNGHTMEVSANKGGIARKTLHTWLNKGAEVIDALYDDENPAEKPSDLYAWGERYAEFYMQMMDAEAQFREELEDQILDAGFGRGKFDDPDWRALKWYAEVVIGDEYSPNNEQVVRHEVQGKVEVAPQLGDGPPAERGPTKEEALAAQAEKEQEAIEADYEIVEDED